MILFSRFLYKANDSSLNESDYSLSDLCSLMDGAFKRAIYINQKLDCSYPSDLSVHILVTD